MQGEGFLNPDDEHGLGTSSRRLRQPGAASSSARSPEATSDAYDRFAPVYDRVNADNDYEMWLGETLLPELEKRGLRKGWALDIGCGTGRAFDPLLQRGWKIVGCDASAGMLGEAERKFGKRVQLLQLDARSLMPISPSPAAPAEGAFQLILLLNDVLNYMTEEEELEQVFTGLTRNLSPTYGLVIFDVNTFSLFRHDFSVACVEGDAEGWEWRGLTEGARPEGIYEALLSGPNIETHIHRQRHWTSQQIQRALEASGLEAIGRLGQREADGEILLSETPDEERDRKIVYIATKAD
jgi:SAM-dependent methyltransferase